MKSDNFYYAVHFPRFAFLKISTGHVEVLNERTDCLNLPKWGTVVLCVPIHIKETKGCFGIVLP